jgi:hypothetical protein
MGRVHPPEKVAQDLPDLVERIQDNQILIERAGFLLCYLGLGKDGDWRQPTFDAGAHVPLIMYDVEVPVSDEKESFKAARRMRLFRNKLVSDRWEDRD